MSYSFSGTTQWLDSAATLTALSNTSFTMACWINVADATPTSTLIPFSLGNSGFTSDRYCALRLLTGGNGNAQAYQSTSSGTSTTDGDADAANDTWFLIVGTFTVNGSNQVTDLDVMTYNGTAEANATPTSGLTKTMSSFDVIRVGAARNSTSTFVGKVAHAAIWTKVLSSAEMTELTTKVPSAVANSDLYAYWPLLTGATETKQGGGTYDLTVNSATLNSGDGPTLSSGSSSVAALAHYYRAMRAD